MGTLTIFYGDNPSGLAFTVEAATAETIVAKLLPRRVEIIESDATTWIPREGRAVHLIYRPEEAA